MEARAIARYVRVSPYKARRVINLIRGKHVAQAQAILDHLPHKAARIIKKTLDSAIANAENNHGLNRDDLYVVRCYVDEGPRLKRIKPRARGVANLILRRTSHITIVVGEKEEE